MSELDRLGLLRTYLAALNPGPVEGPDPARLQSLLMAAWDDIEGSDAGGMRREKVYGRIESATWEPPTLSFEIERHGAWTLGSVYAEVQWWVVNTEEGRAELKSVRQRQIEKRAKAMKIEPIARELADLINRGVDDERLQWRRDRRAVRVRVTQVVGASAPKQTHQSRSRRLRSELFTFLVPSGWSYHGGWWQKG